MQNINEAFEIFRTGLFQNGSHFEGCISRELPLKEKIDSLESLLTERCPQKSLRNPDTYRNITDMLA